MVIVPGNHDLSWPIARSAYRLERRSDHRATLTEGFYIDRGEIIEVRSEDAYRQRFEPFSTFYQAVKGQPYPLEYAQQAILQHLPQQNLLFLGLNSAWQLDHHFKLRAAIHGGALSDALFRIRTTPEYAGCLKIAIWHHPISGDGEDRLRDTGFLEQLAKAGFRLALHGHIHQPRNELFRHDMSVGDRRVDVVCAGTFGAPVSEWVPGYPLGYNLLRFGGGKVIVETRRREALNGAWKPDARWLRGAAADPLPRYEIPL
jgi:3',5'-cyclic AMP phosphodiesterase CpdA